MPSFRALVAIAVFTGKLCSLMRDHDLRQVSSSTQDPCVSIESGLLQGRRGPPLTDDAEPLRTGVGCAAPVDGGDGWKERSVANAEGNARA